jgi:hypothetical protein
MMKRLNGIAASMATALLLATPLAVAQDQPAPKPGFFRQLGDSLKDAGERMVGAKPRPGTRAQTGPIYTPLAGPGRSLGCSRARTISRPKWATWTGPGSR